MVKIGDGSSTLFWKDKWCEVIFQEEFPRAHSYAISEDVTVHEILSAQSAEAVFFLPLSQQATQEA